MSSLDDSKLTFGWLFPAMDAVLKQFPKYFYWIPQPTVAATDSGSWGRHLPPQANSAPDCIIHVRLPEKPDSEVNS